MRVSHLAAMAGVVALTIFASGVSAASKDQAPKPYASDTWYKIETDHFIIYSNASQAETFRQVAAVEQFRFFMDGLLPASLKGNSEPEQKLPVYILADRQDLDYVRPGFRKNVAGVYFACKEGPSAYTTHIDMPAQGARIYDTQDQSQLVLFHEYTHYLMARKGLNHYPMWYIEGLAEYYSTLEYDGTHIAVGTVPFEANWVLDQVNWGNFDTVIAPDEHFSSGLAGSRDDLGIFYAKAWLLTHYMVSSPERRAQLDDYFARLEKGEAPISAFEAATHLQIAALPHILRAYSKALPVQVDTPDEPPHVAGDVTELEDTDEPYVLMGSALQTCPGHEQGAWLLDSLKLQGDETRLRALVAKSKPGDGTEADIYALNIAPKVAANPDYRLTIAYGEILFGDPVEPRAFLAGIASGDDHYDRAQYLLGRSYLATADKAEGAAKAADLAMARPILEQAATRRPDDAPTQFFLAQSLGDQSEALPHALTATRLEPSVYDYAEYAAFLAVRVGDRPTALTLLSSFHSSPHDLDGNKRVVAAIAAIQAGKSADEVWGVMHKDDDDDAKPKDKS